jgi:hypothetical protein
MLADQLLTRGPFPDYWNPTCTMCPDPDANPEVCNSNPDTYDWNLEAVIRTQKVAVLTQQVL